MAIPKLGLRFAGVLRLRLPHVLCQFYWVAASIHRRWIGDGFSPAKHLQSKAFGDDHRQATLDAVTR